MYRVCVGQRTRLTQLHVCVDRPEYCAVGDYKRGALVLQDFVDSGKYAGSEGDVSLGLIWRGAVSPTFGYSPIGRAQFALQHAEIAFLKAVHASERQV